MKNKKLIIKFLATIAAIFLLITSGQAKNSSNSIQPWADNLWYWQYKGEPVMLLGASNDDNLFQWPVDILIPHLDSMKAIGANYVRNTMSDRPDRGFELYPYKKLKNGKYDLNRWNDAYWNRFDFFLKETAKRDIIVQIEVWDRFDYSRENWLPHPYNPKNNVNYSFKETRLDSVYPNHPGANDQPFFFTTPHQQNNTVLLNFQNRFVEKMLSYSLAYDHVLYCIDNETSGEEEWTVYWAAFILRKAKEKGKKVCVTEMWDDWNLKAESHKRTFDHPELFAYCDVSQNNHQIGKVHWDNFQWVRHYLAPHPRPLNTVKTYGADGGRHGSTKDGLERWWRHIIGGSASARFHRPPSGLGLSTFSINSIKIAREIEKIVPFWELKPDLAALEGFDENEAYLASKTGEYYVVFFSNGGEVKLNLNAYLDFFKLKWFDIRNGELVLETQVEGGEKITLKAPGKLEWIAVLERM